MAELRSPLADVNLPAFVQNWQGQAGLTIETMKPASLVQVQAWPDTVEAVAQALSGIIGTRPDFSPGATTAGVSGAAGVIGPGRLLIETETSDLAETVARSISPEIGAITDLGHARLVFVLSGDEASFVLSKGINIDFDQAAFPVRTVKATGIHGIPLVIARQTPDRFRIFAPTTFAGAFAEWLSEAARDVGYRLIS